MGNSQSVSSSFTSTGGAQTLAIPCNVDYMVVYNQTVQNTNNPAFTQLAMESKWFGTMAAGSALVLAKSTGTNNIVAPVTTSGGFTVIDNANPGTNPAIALTTFTPGYPTQWTTSTNTFAVGDIVRVYNLTGSNQYDALDLSVIVADSTHFTSLLNTTGYASSSAGFVRKINLDKGLYYPKKRYISQVTTGSTTTVQLTVQHGYQVGEYVRFIVPAIFGMKELNGLRGKILSIDTSMSGADSTANTIVVDINSSSFTAFAYPQNGNLPFSQAIVVPDSEFPTFINAATKNVGIKGIQLGANICGNNGDTINWIAYQVDQVL